MADIATIFHWPPSAMDGMGLAELAEWRERARVRSGAEE
ncbi:MAG: GpE family phage tail protein [Pseudomonadota bacterium]